MKKAVKSKRRINFLNELADTMMKYEYFSRETTRKGMNEGDIQRATFNYLNSRSLSPLISKHFNIKKEKAKQIVRNGFIYEKKKKVHLKNFKFFSANHRADAVLTLKDIRIAFEIKKGDSGLAVRSGIGQSIVYAFQFDFVLYFFIDITPGGDIENSRKSIKEKQLIDSLWEDYNIKFFIV